MLTVMCVLKSGGGYDATWVERLKNGVARNMKRPHRFVCLSDVEVPCERIPLRHDWAGWWSKLEMFREGVITSDTLYLDLDTVITGSLDDVARIDCEFAMLTNFHRPEMVGSGVMWFSKVPTHVYDRFAKQPQAWIDHHVRNQKGSYIGDQAFVWDAMRHNLHRINDHFAGIKSYKYHCRKFLPSDAKIVCFHGKPKLTEVNDDWIKEHWDGNYNLRAA